MKQQAFIGVNSIKNLSSIFNSINVKKIFLVTGKKSYSQSGAKLKLSSYLNNLEILHFNDFEVNPKIEDVYKGITKFKDFNPDIILSIGGGSVIDMAKLINTLSFQSNPDLSKYIKGKLQLNEQGLPLIAIPTTAGTGSEATHFSVIYINKIKYSLANLCLLPKYAIIDPTFTYNIPSKIAADTAMDALCQAVESFWATQSNDLSKDFAKKSIIKILSSISKAINKEDTSAKNQLSEASYYAGKAINITKTTAPHAISYPITTHFNVAHGHAVALTLGKFFKINSNINNSELNDPRGKEYLKTTMDQIFKLFKCDNSQTCEKKWYSILDEIGLEYNFKKLGISNQEDINLIINNVNLERLNNNPIKVNKEILKSLF